MESVAAFMTLIVRRRLVSAQESADMHDLLTRAATSGSGTWTKYALDGFDDQSDASLTRTHLSVGGKIGFLHRGTKAQWWDTVYTMSDASIVQKTAGHLPTDPIVARLHLNVPVAFADNSSCPGLRAGRFPQLRVSARS